MAIQKHSKRVTKVSTWDAKLAPLQRHPSLWVNVGEFSTSKDASQTANSLKSHKRTLNEDWEFAVRNNHLYARYIDARFQK